MGKLAVMIFDSNDEIHDFLSSHKDLKLLDKKTQEFLVVETEKSDNKKYKNRIVARFTSENDKLFIYELERYKRLSDEAKKIISYAEIPVSNDYENPIKIQIGKMFNGIEITKDLYYETYHFAVDNGLNFWRHNVEDGEVVEIALLKDSILVLN